MHQSILKCTKVYQSIPEYTKVYQSIPECTKVYQSVPECTRVYQSVLGGVWYIALRYFYIKTLKLLNVIAFLDGAISSPNGAICISILLLVRKGAVKNGVISHLAL